PRGAAAPPATADVGPPRRRARALPRRGGAVILYVLRYYPTLTETFVYREITELARRGVGVVVAALGERADGALQDELPDVPVLRAPSLPLTPPRPADLWWLARRQRLVRALRAGWIARRARALGVTRV